ncbi:MAG: cupin [Actinomycetota bacterium]
MTDAPETLVVPCDDLDDAIAACEAVGFRLDATGPADEPTWAELSRGDLTIALDVAAPSRGPGLRSATAAPVEFPPSLPVAVVSHEADGDWKAGRAGMRYRDLIPDRYGGTYIASHIHVPDGGPVPDYVHHHDIIHQLIVCHRGWVRVVYQDQGSPLTMRAGDCILQPPGIRHRVLEASDDLYVIEVGCPAEHRTSLDHDLELPNGQAAPGGSYGGQGFVHHVAAEAPWVVERGCEYQDTGLGEASNGLVSVRRWRGNPLRLDLDHDDDLRLLVVTDGAATLTRPDGSTTDLLDGSSATVPPGESHHLEATDRSTVVLDVTTRVPTPV